MSAAPRIWVLLGSRRGDNNQLLALAEAFGLPFETRTIFTKPTARLRMKLFPESIGHVAAESRRWLEPPWPDLTIGIGRRSVAVAQWLKRQSGGQTRSIRIGHPRVPSGRFDLVITTPQYPIPPAKNVITLPLAMNRFRAPAEPTAHESAWFDRLPRPHLLLSIGGTAPMWRLDLNALGDAATRLAKRADAAGGTLIVIGSRRTPTEAQAIVRDATADNENVTFADSTVRYPILVSDADEQFVTADSVSMASEAILSGKPVGLVPVEPDRRGRWWLRGDPATTQVRDIRRFWDHVRSLGLVGTVDEPRRGTVENPVEMAVNAVRERLGDLFG